MITLHDAKETNFEKNGYGVLDDLIFNDGGSWEMNGEFKITFEIPALTEFTNYLEARNIVKAPVPFMDRQLFRIYRTEKTLTSIYIEARHIFYDLLDNWIEDTNIVSQTGNSAIQQLLSRTQYPHRFTATSDITATGSARIVRMNPVEALIDDQTENSFVSRWGGELVRNNFQIELLERMGADRGVKIEHRKDLLGYEATIDISTIVTRIHPVGFDGLELPEKYVDSPLIDPDHPIIAEVKYEDIKAAVGEYADDEEAVPLEQAYELLRQAASNEFSVNHVDEPETVVNVDFVALHNTEQYKDFADLQEVRAGDTVKVSAYDHGFEITSRLVAFDFSLLKENQYTSTTLGNHVLEFTTSGPSVEKLESRLDDVQQSVVTAVLAANGRNRNFFGTADPNTLQLDPRVGDLYFLENGETEVMYRFVEVNGERYWKRIVDEDTEVNKRAIEEQQEQIALVKEDADFSRDQIEQSILNSNFTSISDIFTDVRSISEQAESDAYEAMQLAMGTDGRLTLAEQFLDGFRNTAFDPSTGQLSLTEQTIAGLQNTVSDPVNGLETRVTTIANGFQALSSDVDGLESQLAVTNENVLARVEKGDVYSQLKIDSRNILFDAYDRIMLSADKVVIDAAETFIPGAVIENASIDSAKISEIDGNIANIININVDNIVGNRSEFIQSYWNDINSSVQITSSGLVTTGTNTFTEIKSGYIYNEGQLNGELAQVFLEQGSMLLSQGLYEGALSPRNGLILQNGGTMGVQVNYSGLNVFTPDGDIFFGVDGIQLSNGAFIERLGPVSDGMEWSVPGFMHFSAWGSRAFSVYSDAVSFYRTLSTEGNTIAARNVDANNAYDVLGLNAYRTDLADFSLGKYSSGGRYVRSTAIREATTSSGANVSIASSGDIRTSVSARKYKDDIKTVTNQLDLGKAIMSLEIKSWYDKAEIKASVSPLNRYYGLIAEEVAEAGLTKFVDYVDGEIEGIYYDRLWIPLVPVVADHESRIDNVVTLASKAYLKSVSNEERIKALEDELKTLKGAS